MLQNFIYGDSTKVLLSQFYSSVFKHFSLLYRRSPSGHPQCGTGTCVILAVEIGLNGSIGIYRPVVVDTHVKKIMPAIPGKRVI